MADFNDANVIGAINDHHEDPSDTAKLALGRRALLDDASYARSTTAWKWDP